MMASPISMVPIDLPPQAMSLDRIPSAIVFLMAYSMADASSSIPKLYLSISAALRTCAHGLAKFFPAMSGAVPPAGS